MDNKNDKEKQPEPDYNKLADSYLKRTIKPHLVLPPEKRKFHRNKLVSKDSPKKDS